MYLLLLFILDKVKFRIKLHGEIFTFLLIKIIFFWTTVTVALCS